MAISKSQQATIDVNHYNALRQLEAGAKLDEIHHVTGRKLIERGFVTDAGVITDDGRNFLGDTVAPTINSAVVPAAETSSFDPRISRTKYAEQSASGSASFVQGEITEPTSEPTMTTIMSEREFYAEMQEADEFRLTLRQLRDSSLGLVESIVAQKAPEVLPVLASIRRANEVLSE